MQRKSVGKVMRGLMAAVLLISSFTLFACGGGDGDTNGDGGSNDGTPVLLPQDQRVTLNAATAQALLGAVVNQPFTISDGSTFNPGIPPNTQLTLEFTGAPTTAPDGTVTVPFKLTTLAGQTATGTATIASCTFFIVTSTIPGLASGTTILTFNPSDFTINAPTLIVPGGDSVTGTITGIVFSRGTVIIVIARANGAISITVKILANGHLVINGVDTGVVIPLPSGSTGTGSTGTGGTP
jgi:hypothetical protein